MDITGSECPSKVLIGKVSFHAELMKKFPIFIENLLLVDTMVPLSSLQIEFEFSMLKYCFYYHIRKLSFDMDLPLCFYLW